MIVGCKQDLERVELPYVEIEAMVNIIKTLKIIFILLIIIAHTKMMNILLVILTLLLTIR